MQGEAVMQAAVVDQPQVACSSQIDVQADTDLQARVSCYLAGRRHWALRNLDVSSLNGTVTIKGVVESFYEKQLVVHCCQRVAGVLKLVDEVEVI